MTNELCDRPQLVFVFVDGNKTQRQSVIVVSSRIRSKKDTAITPPFVTDVCVERVSNVRGESARSEYLCVSRYIYRNIYLDAHLPY